MRISDWSSDVCSSDLGQRFGELMGIKRIVGDQHLFHAVELGGGFGNGVEALACNENMHFRAELGCGGDGLGGGVVELLVVVLCNYQRGHLIDRKSTRLNSSH